MLQWAFGRGKQRPFGKHQLERLGALELHKKGFELDLDLELYCNRDMVGITLDWDLGLTSAQKPSLGKRGRGYVVKSPSRLSFNLNLFPC